MSAADDQAGSPESPEYKASLPATDVSPLTEVARSQLQPDAPLQVAIPRVEAIRADPPAQVAIAQGEVLRADPPLEVVNGPIELQVTQPPEHALDTIEGIPVSAVEGKVSLDGEVEYVGTIVYEGKVSTQGKVSDIATERAAYIPSGGGNVGDDDAQRAGINGPWATPVPSGGGNAALGSPTTIDPPPVRIGGSAFPTLGNLPLGSSGLEEEVKPEASFVDDLHGTSIDGVVQPADAEIIPGSDSAFRPLDQTDGELDPTSSAFPTSGETTASSEHIGLGNDEVAYLGTFSRAADDVAVEGVLQPSDAELITDGAHPRVDALPADPPLEVVNGPIEVQVTQPPAQALDRLEGSLVNGVEGTASFPGEVLRASPAAPSGAGNIDDVRTIHYPGKIEGIDALGSPTTVDPPPVRAPWSKPVWGIAAALLLIVPLAFVGGVLSGLGAEPGATDPAGALPPKKSDPPGAGGAEASAIVPNGGIGATAGPGGEPGSTASTGGEPTAGSGPGTVPTPKPTLKPSNPAPTKPGSEATTAPGGKLKITPTEVDASCNKGLSTFDIILDNSGSGTDASWTLQFGPGVAGGAWGTASQSSGTVPSGQFFIVAIEPADLCKVLGSPTTFELTISVGGAQTQVAYTVTP